MNPFIGITCGTYQNTMWCPPLFDYRQTYIDAITTAKGLSLLIPPLQDENLLCELYEQIDGLLLTGGGTISPAIYGEEPLSSLEWIDSVRDYAELYLAHRAISEGKPVLGICRGAQLINVVMGGTLYQDIASQLNTALKHTPTSVPGDWTNLTHEISIEPTSKLAHILDTHTLLTNSLHHQAIKTIPPGLRAVAWAHDGVIEAIEGANQHFLIGIQCHPETLQSAVDMRWQALFKAFVQESIAFHQYVVLVA